MIEIDNLCRAGEMLLGEVPDPNCPVTQHDTPVRLVESSPRSLTQNPRGELGSRERDSGWPEGKGGRIPAGELKMSIRAIYEKGVFKPLEDVPIKEGTEVEVYPLSEQRTNTADGSKPKRKSVKDYAAYGMWKDRDDIGTGVEYVNRIRQPRWKRSE